MKMQNKKEKEKIHQQKGSWKCVRVDFFASLRLENKLTHEVEINAQTNEIKTNRKKEWKNEI